MAILKAPFPYFGGKSRVASVVWEHLGDVAHYIEPFFGSGAVLLARPRSHKRKIETVCELEPWLANVWRALQFAPDEVARWCDWPSSHADLMARKRELWRRRRRLMKRMATRPEYCDPKLAGYWIWVASTDIGVGMRYFDQVQEMSRQGRGVHAMQYRFAVEHPSRDVREPYRDAIREYFRRLGERLREVHTVWGDWSRICGGEWQADDGTAGIFFDPPYSVATGRDMRVYTSDVHLVADKVREWCLERGGRADHRIVLAGYYEEHEELLSRGWTVHRWSAGGGYANQGGSERADARHREALFLSPHCLRATLFTGAERAADLPYPWPRNTPPQP